MVEIFAKGEVGQGGREGVEWLVEGASESQVGEGERKSRYRSKPDIGT